MKKALAVLVFIVFVFAATGSAYAEIHKLWGIDYGESPEDVISALKEEKGIIMEVDEDEIVPFLGRFTILNSADNQNITILGYPIDVSWAIMGDIHIIGLSFDEDGSTISQHEALTRQNHIYENMVSAYGQPNLICLEIFSEGKDAYENNSCDNIHEVKFIDDAKDVDVMSYISELSYYTERTEASLLIYIDNIEIISSFIPSYDHCHLSVMFKNRVYETFANEVYEEYKYTSYKDTGF